MKRKFAAVLIVVSIIVISLSSYASIQLQTINPSTGVFQTIDGANISSGTYIIPGLDHSVTVDIDTSGMAHIHASNLHDLFYAQGYYSASMRLFQMELQSSIAAGNVSQFVGAAGIPSDLSLRTVGLNTDAMILVQYMKENYPQYYSYLQDYASGVNAYINQTGGATHLGFKLLGISPFKWTVFDSLVWQEYMAWSLATGSCSVLQSDIFYNAMGFQNYSTIYPYYPYFTQNITMIPGNGTVNGYNLSDQGISPEYFWDQNFFQRWATGVPTSTLNSIQPLLEKAYENIKDPFSLPGSHDFGSSIGSNSWIVTSNYSSDGVPMMANDPHLPLLAPSLWIPLQLIAPGMNVTGWGLAGLPGILIGHTPTTSFGLTTPEGNSANDYLEILNGNDYLYNGSYYPMTEQNITLAGEHFTLYSTNNGPLIARDGNYGISLNWDARSPSLDAIAEIMLDQSTNYSQMMNALKYWGPAPPQNFALVSLHHAGYITAGGYPLIHETLPDGKKVDVVGSVSLLNGSMPAYEPHGYVPFRYLPQAVNPKRGYMFAPNQPTVGKNYPYPFVGSYWTTGGRAQTISHYLASHQKMNISDMMQLQSNVSNYWAQQFTPILLKALVGMRNLNYSETTALGMLSTWNFTYTQNMTAPTVYYYFTAALYNLSFYRIYSDHNLRPYEPNPYINTAIYLAENDPDSSWFNGNFTKLAREAFVTAVGFMVHNLGNTTNWKWGGIHKLEICSLTELPQLSIGPIPIWGGRHTVSVGYTPRVLEYPIPYVLNGSSLRTIARPGTGTFYGVFPGGPSENILSYWFDNQLGKWLNHQYYKMTGLPTEVVITYEP